MGEGGVAEIVEQHAFAVGQHDRVAGTGQLLVQVRHLDLGDGLHIGQPLLALLQFGRRDDFGLGAGARIEPIFVEASDPGLGDPVAGANAVAPIRLWTTEWTRLTCSTAKFGMLSPTSTLWTVL
jgi:hypothetical protein